MMKEFNRNQNSQKDFFISYKNDDLVWAEWIAWQLEQAEYSTEFPGWEFRSFDLRQEMQKAVETARHAIVILSPSYLRELTKQPEWIETFEQALKENRGTLIPVLVHPCVLIKVLGLRKCINFIEEDEFSAHNKLIGDISSIIKSDSKADLAIFPKGIPQPSRLTHPPRYPRTYPSGGNIPSDNLLFTGRRKDIEQLSEMLTTNRPVAISGLGGIGKTQIAIAYVYQYYHFYRNVIWVNADNHESTIQGLVDELGDDLPNGGVATKAIKRWLGTNDHWLLVFDNAYDIETILKEFIPNQRRGHILLTTRTQNVAPFAQAIDINKLNQEEGALLLLRRAKNNFTLELSTVPLDDLNIAQKISYIMDGLPLALDQAGAHIYNAESKLSDCLNSCHGHQLMTLLNKRGKPILGHPKPVTETWTKDFEKVTSNNLAAVELLSFCACLYPDDIPLSLIKIGAPEIGLHLHPIGTDSFLLDDAIEELRKHSLISRSSEEDLLSIHRLVQFVLKNEMDPHILRRWAERTVRAFYRILQGVDLTTNSNCQRCFLLACTCAGLIDECGLVIMEAVQLLCHLAYYLHEGENNEKAEKHYQRALTLCDQIFGPDSNEAVDIKKRYKAWSKGNNEKVEGIYTHIPSDKVQQPLPADKNDNGKMPSSDVIPPLHENEEIISRNDLFNRLTTCPSTIFETAVFYFNPPKGLFSSNNQITRAIELINWAEHPDGPSLKTLIEAYLQAIRKINP